MWCGVQEAQRHLLEDSSLQKHRKVIVDIPVNTEPKQEEENAATKPDEFQSTESWTAATKLIGHGKEHEKQATGLGGMLDAFGASLSIIIVSEIGDETFIIAALMAMRHPRFVIWFGAISALVVMTVLSTALGLIVPNVVSRQHTNAAATVLYTFFGLRLLWIAYKSDKSEGTKEFEEVEEKIEASTPGAKNRSRVRKVLSRFITPIFLEAFVLTFLAEWGDRSQIATIAMASHKNPVGVTIGAVVGHALCSGIAVCGGRMLAARISQRSVATVGGVLFLLFAMHSFVFPPV
eukprot:jgi/Chlat1/4202/Chrsp27S04240